MAPDALRGRRILVVEDEGLILLMLQDMLHTLGCVVAATATRPETALAALAGSEVDAAMLDVNLGGGANSFAVAEALEERGVPFLFLTGYGTETLPPDWRNRPVLSKPVDERTLARILARLLDRRTGSGRG